MGRFSFPSYPTKIASWLFGVLFTAAFVYIAFHHFNLPRILIGKTQTTSGYVVQTFVAFGPGGETYQRIRYVFTVNENSYFDYTNIGQKEGIQTIGNGLQIQYKQSSPLENKIVGFLPSAAQKTSSKYIAGNSSGYSEIDLTNGIINFKAFKNGGKIALDWFGLYHEQRDTLKISYFETEPNSRPSILPDYLIFDINRENLIDPEHQLNYKNSRRR